MPTRLLHFLAAAPRFRVAVVGDLMLDRYVWGSASRISQEAPVPVVRVNRESCCPGGAANVAGNIASLGAKATVFGTIGQDPYGETLIAELARRGIDAGGVVRTGADRETTVKTRVIANHQQVVRVDREDTSPLSDPLRDQLRQRLLHGIANGHFDALILEDYAKGLFTAPFMQEIANAARAQGLIVALDPHPCHVFDIHGLTLCTPNRMEAFALAGKYFQPGRLPLADDLPLLEVGAQLLASWGVEHLLITLGGEGMALFEAARPPLHIPTRAREVYDVSGAGDTVTASYVLALLAGADSAAAAEFANHAAGIVVAKMGTVPVEAEELRSRLEAEADA